MVRRFCCLGFGVSFLIASAAPAEIAVSLRALDVMGNPVSGPVAAGSQLTIEVRIAATGDDTAIPDIRDFVLDFSASTDTLGLIAFAWEIDATAYAFQANSLPSPNAATIFLQPGPGLLTLSNASELIGVLTVSVAGGGTIDAVTGDPVAGFGGAAFNAGFEEPREFSVANGLVTGGRLDIVVTGSPPPPTDPDDTDGDGVPNDLDAFPDDPDEAVDTDEDGVGNNADTFPDDPNEVVDTDGNGVGDNADPDDDGDGVLDEDDAFPLDPEHTEADDTDGGNGDGGSGGGSTPAPRLCGLGMLGSFAVVLMALAACRPRSGGPRASRMIHPGDPGLD